MMLLIDDVQYAAIQLEPADGLGSHAATAIGTSAVMEIA
jgi:hypothetical protein